MSFEIGDRVRIHERATALWGGPLVEEGDDETPLSAHAGELGVIVHPLQHPYDGADGPLGGYDCIVRLDKGGTVRYNFHELEHVYVTKTGRVLTDEDLEKLADEAEAGYEMD